MSLAGLLLTGFGPGGGDGGDPPDTPALAVADNADGTGAVAMITGSTSGSANTVYTRSITGSAWVSSGSRTGNGTVALSLAVGSYWAYVRSTTSGGAATSNLVLFAVTSGAESVYYRCLMAVRDRIRLLALDGIDADDVQILTVPWADRFFGSGRQYDFPGIIVAPYTSETMSPNAGTNVRDEIGYPVLVSAVDASNQTQPDSLARYLDWRERIRKAFIHQRLDLASIPEVYRVTVEPGPVVVEGVFRENLFHSPLILRCVSREGRGA